MGLDDAAFVNCVSVIPACHSQATTARIAVIEAISSRRIPRIPRVAPDRGQEKFRRGSAESPDFCSIRTILPQLGCGCPKPRHIPTMLSTSRGTVVQLILAVSLTFTASFTGKASAQFSVDPFTPLTLAATANDDVQPKIAPAPGGGNYVSFFGGAGYDVMLTRLDTNGVAVWKSGSILVEDRVVTSTTDYGLASDPNGVAYLAYDGVFETIPAILVCAVAPDGSILWRKAVSSSASAYLAVGRVTVASDGAVWVAHVQDSTSRVQRFEAATGTPTFAVPVTLSELSNTQMPADIQPSVDGAVIVSCVRYTTFNGAKILRAHRINADGTKPWASIGVSVFTTGSLQFGNFPPFISDGAGGAYFCWYTSSPLQCSVQRMSAAGVNAYGASGITVTTTTTGYNRVSPSMTLGTDSKLYVFWPQQVPNTSNYGVFGQCFSKGLRQWGVNGVAVQPMDTTMYSRDFANASRVGDGIVCYWVDNTSAVQGNMRCAGVDGAGAVLWTSNVATNSGVKYRLSSADAADSGSILAWQGGSTGASDVFAARIGADGVVGPPAAGIFGDLDGDGVVAASDLAILLSQWGGSGSGDLDGDGVVGAGDLSALLGAWTA